MRTLLVDDERLARKELRRLLASHPEVEVVGEAADAEAARDAIEELDPDLIFLDVQMPGETGFDLLESLDHVPRVIFCTAYDEYALRAFEVSALDYLVKPVEPGRLERSLERILPLDSSPGRSGDRADVLGPHHRIFLKDGERCWLVELGEVRLFEAADHYTQVHLADDAPLILRSLSELEERLDPRVFFRANRSQIVNLESVASIHPWFGGRLMAKLKGGHEVVLSRRRAREFRERMSV